MKFEIGNIVHFYNKKKENGKFVVIKTKSETITAKKIESISGLLNIKDIKSQIKNLSIGDFDCAICQINPNPYSINIKANIILVDAEHLIQVI